MRRLKLIRDKLPKRKEITETLYASPTTNQLLLAGKVHEEVVEIASAGFTDPEEYADAVQALMDLAEFSGVSWSEVERVRREKLREKGGFTRFRVMLWDGRDV